MPAKSRGEGEGRLNGGLQPPSPPSPKVFAKVDLIPIDNDNEKKKIVKKKKILILLVTLLLSTSCNA